MTNYIRAFAELSITEGKLDEFKELANSLIEKVDANEPDALTYEWFLSEDGSKCYVVEMYKDSASVMAHLGNVGDLMGPLFEIAPLTELKVYGSPSEEVKQAIAPLGAQVFEHFNGITR